MFRKLSRRICPAVAPTAATATNGGSNNCIADSSKSAASDVTQAGTAKTRKKLYGRRAWSENASPLESAKEQKFPRLFSEIKVGPHTLTNRFVMSPLYLNVEERYTLGSDDFWNVTAAFYSARAENGAQLICVQSTSPAGHGKWNANSLVLSTKGACRGFRQVTDAIHEYGGLAILPITHAGRAALDRNYQISSTDDQSPLVRVKYARQFGIPDILMFRIVSEHVRAARLALQAGFDGVEIPVVHGGLLHNFVSPAINTRPEDSKYSGATLETRAAIVLEVLQAIREEIPKSSNFIIAVRICVHDLLPGGSTREEIHKFAEMLVKDPVMHGVDLLTTSVGHPESPVPTLSSRVPRAAFSEACKGLRKYLREKGYTHVPLVASHRINSAHVAEKLLENDCCDMVGVGRALLADAQFISNAQAGQPQFSTPCIGCNTCMDSFYRGERVTCAVNPTSAFELEKLPLRPTEFPRSVAVVGAGPAGIVCALTLSLRGHDVVLYESGSEIGGQLNLAKVIPGKDEYFLILEHWTQQLKNSKVRVKLNSKFTVDEVSGGHQMFHAVVCCTGGIPRPIERMSSIWGWESIKNCTFAEVLTRQVVPGKRVAVLGHGATAYDVASYLLHDPRVSREVARFEQEWGVDIAKSTLDLEQQTLPIRNGREVMVFDKGHIPPDLPPSTGWALKRQIINHEGSLMRAHLLHNITDRSGLGFGTMPQINMRSSHAATRPESSLERAFNWNADTIVFARGMLPNLKLRNDLQFWLMDGAVERGQAPVDFRIYNAGQCRETYTRRGQGDQDLKAAVQDGFEIGQTL